MTLVCPVTLARLSNGKFKLPEAQHKIMKDNLAGHYYWDPDEKMRKRKKPIGQAPVPTMEPTTKKKPTARKKNVTRQSKKKPVKPQQKPAAPKNKPAKPRQKPAPSKKQAPKRAQRKG